MGFAFNCFFGTIIAFYGHELVTQKFSALLVNTGYMVLDIFNGIINSLQMYFELDEQYSLTKNSHMVGHSATGISSLVSQRLYPWQTRFSIGALGALKEQRDLSLISKLWSSQEIQEFDFLKLKNFILRKIDYHLYSSVVLQFSMPFMKYYPKVGLGMGFITKSSGNLHGLLCPINPDDMFIIQNMYDRGKALSTDVNYFMISEFSYRVPHDVSGDCKDDFEIMMVAILLCCCFQKIVTIFIVILFSPGLLVILFIRMLTSSNKERLVYKHMMSSSRKEEYNYKYWFYQLNMTCDNIDIHCIIDERLEIKYRYLQAYYRRNDRLGHILDSNISSSQSKKNKLSEFERIYSNKSKKHCDDRLLMQNILTEASTNRYHILLRWVIAHMKENNMTVDDIKGTLDIAIEKNDKDIAKAISWYMTREFFVKFANQLKDATDIFPGIRCSCRGSIVLDCSFCTNERVIIILTRTAIKEKPDTYHGFTIEEVNPDLSNSDDSEAVTISNLLSSKYTNSYFLKVNLPQNSVENIFNRHSNVTLICPSVLMSKSFDRVHAVQERICIHLYCKKKGIIPLGEDHFPTSIHGIPTDIIEGNISFITKLRIGEKIGPQTSIGTLGGFVKYMDFECFLTCAHVMFDLQTLLSSSYDFSLLGAKAFCHSLQGPVNCGKVLWRTFDHDDKLKTSIDAALVMMQNNASFDQNDFILDRYGNACHFLKLGLSSPFLNDNCLDHEDFCIPQQTAKVVGAGSMTKLEENVQFPKQTDVDILFSSTGQTATVVNGNVFQPLWINSQAHMQLSTGFLNDKRIFRMYNQITINLRLQPGDSGTCIYIVQHPYNKNGCIGMAIAFCGGMTVVTPLKDILKRISSS